MRLHYLNRSGTRLAYYRCGSGPLVVLVHGIGLPGRMWIDLPRRLADEGFAVLAPDARGTGSSDVTHPPYTMRQLAADLAAVIDDGGCGPALVCGISFGGMVAQHLALRFPDRVSGLVLAATTSGWPLARPIPPRAIRLLVQSVFARTGERREAIYRHLAHPDSFARDPKLFAPWKRRYVESPTSARGFVGQLGAGLFHGTGLALARISCPTEVITGEADAIIPPGNSQILARRIPQAELTVIPRAGHVFPVEYPEALVSAILRTHQRRSRP